MSAKNGIIGQRLRMARFSAGFRSRTAAADAAGLSPNTLKLYEAGETMPGAEKLYDLATLYNAGVGWLLGKDDQRDSLPAGKTIVDQVLIDKVLLATDEGELASLLQREPSPILCMLKISEGSRLVKFEEAVELRDKVTWHLMSHAPSAMREWFARFGDGRKRPSKKRTKKGK